MKRIILLIVFSIFSFFISHAQKSNSYQVKNHIENFQKDSIRVDTLLKFVRNQYYKKNYDRTIEVGEEAIQLASKINDYKTVFKLSSLMGNAFLNIEDTLQAKKIFTKTLLHAAKVKDTQHILAARIDLGNMYALKDKYQAASQSYIKALPLAKKFNDTVLLFILNYNITEMNIELKKIEEADFYVSQMQQYITNLRVKTYHAASALILGKYYVLKKSPDKAVNYLIKGIEISEQENYMEGLIEGHEDYARAEALRGNFSTAYRLVQKADSLKGEQYKLDKIEAVQTATAKYKLNQFKQELKAQKLQNEFKAHQAEQEIKTLWARIGGMILLIFLIFAFYSNRKRKKLLIDLTRKNRQYLEEKEKSDELSRAKSTLFSTISHELRTPMYGIIGISSLLIEDKSLKNHQENIQSLKFSADYLLSLINNVLQLNKLDADQTKSLGKEKFNIRELVQNAIKSSEFIRSNNQNTFEVNIHKDVPHYLIGDDVKLAQVLINIIGNSVKFTENGIIYIEILKKYSDPDKTCLQFLIKDSGIGISPEIQGQIFNEFSQTSQGGNFPGTGLGLPIVKKILDLHHSDITLKSELGQGTEIQFNICYEVPINQNKNIELPPKIGEFAPKGKTILVVDDNKINQLVTQKNLKKLGFESKAASCGFDALEMMVSEEFDLVLMDVNMPEMDGFQTTFEIRKFNKSIPIIALTAVEINEIKEKITLCGMNDYIIKPYDTTLFSNSINKQLNCF